jgi:ribosomal protein S18 acetylase RimI-like enzyme
MTDTIHVQALNPKQWELYKAVRLEALISDPQAFGEAFDTAEAKSQEQWISLLTTSTDLFLLKNHEAIGMVCSWQTDIDKKNNSTNMYGLYVQQDERNKGYGKMLVRSLLKELKKKRMHKIKLNVNVLQVQAVAIYKDLGFLEVGKSRAKMGDGNFYEEIEMVKEI